MEAEYASKGSVGNRAGLNFCGLLYLGRRLAVLWKTSAPVRSIDSRWVRNGSDV